MNHATESSRAMKLLQVTAAGLLLAATPPPAARTHVVRLDRNRFVPAESPVSRGDTVRFINGEGGPHNVEFLKDSITAADRARIEQAMGPAKIGPLSGPLLIFQNEVWTFVVPDLTPGRYAFLCSPHWANMQGALVVQH